MAASRASIADALQAIESFSGPELTPRIGALERSITGCDGDQCNAKAIEAGVTSHLLAAAYSVKRAAGQINVLIHAVGALLLLPKIMERGERVEYVSLGAGNTGRKFDLETDRRVAEFKFIHWQGGSETIRQNSLFKDFYLLAEYPTEKRKELYVLDPKYPLRFLRSDRKLRSVLSRNVKLWREFEVKHGKTCSTVGQYYEARRLEVRLCDAAPLVPELLPVVNAGATKFRNTLE